MLKLLSIFCCSWWRGHHLIKKYEPGKVRLVCTLCPYESEGWEIIDRYARYGGRSYKYFCQAYEEMTEADLEVRTGG